jgi:putative copper resistance protein D
MEIALSIARFLHYSAAIQLFGTAVFETWIASAALSNSLLSLSRRIAVFNAWLLLLSAIAWLAFEAGSMGDGWSDTINPATLWLVLTATSFGKAWIANLLLGAACVLAAHRAAALCWRLRRCWPLAPWPSSDTRWPKPVPSGR